MGECPAVNLRAPAANNEMGKKGGTNENIESLYVGRFQNETNIQAC
jgi:hypothetical protein